MLHCNPLLSDESGSTANSAIKLRGKGRGRYEERNMRKKNKKKLTTKEITMGKKQASIKKRILGWARNALSAASFVCRII
jgi:hypothetical protein